MRKLKFREKRTGKYFDKGFRNVGNKCSVTDKFIYLSEASCVIVIRIEGKYGKVAPYRCKHCHKIHMTSDERTVKHFYTRKETRRDAKERAIAIRTIRQSSTLD